VVGLLRRLFGSPAPAPAPAFDVAAGAQRVVDTRLLLNAQRFYVGLSASDRLDLFRSIYYGTPLAVGAVNVIVRMTNSRPRFNSGNPDVDRRCRQIWQTYRLHQVNDSLIRQSRIYGYCSGDGVWGAREPLTLDRVVVPPSYEIRVLADERGQRTGYLQLPSIESMRPLDRRTIPPEKCIAVTRDPTDLQDYYGSSLFESAVGQFDSLCQILKAQITVMQRLGKPRFQVAIPTEGLSEEQFRERLTAAKNVFAQIGSVDADLFVPAGVEVKIIGGETLGVKVADETRLVVSMLLAAVGIPPALLHVTITGSVGTESYARQSILVMQSMLDNIQEATAAAWNTSFWRIVQRLEGMPVAPQMSFEKPRLLEQQIEEQARALRWENDLTEVRYGIRAPEWLAQRCGADEAYDPDLLADKIEEEPEAPATPDAARAESTTKGTDERATGNKEL